MSGSWCVPLAASSCSLLQHTQTCTDPPTGHRAQGWLLGRVVKNQTFQSSTPPAPLAAHSGCTPLLSWPRRGGWAHGSLHCCNTTARARQVC
jgi:hypothetical protein